MNKPVTLLVLFLTLISVNSFFSSMLNVFTLIPYKIIFVIMYVSFFIFMDIKPYVCYIMSSVFLVFLGLIKPLVSLVAFDSLVVLFFLTLIIDILYDMFHSKFRGQHR